jgi:hypothetical protein
VGYSEQLVHCKWPVRAPDSIIFKGQALPIFPQEPHNFHLNSLIIRKNHGPGRTRAEKGAAKGGKVHANCVGQPGSVAEFRQSPVGL